MKIDYSILISFKMYSKVLLEFVVINIHDRDPHVCVFHEVQLLIKSRLIRAYDVAVGMIVKVWPHSSQRLCMHRIVPAGFAAHIELGIGVIYSRHIPTRPSSTEPLNFICNDLTTKYFSIWITPKSCVPTTVKCAALYDFFTLALISFINNMVRSSDMRYNK